MAMFEKTHRIHCMLGENPLGHIPQNSLPDTLSACGIFMQSAEKSDDASYAQVLFGVALAFFYRLWYNKCTVLP